MPRERNAWLLISARAVTVSTAPSANVTLAWKCSSSLLEGPSHSAVAAPLQAEAITVIFYFMKPVPPGRHKCALGRQAKLK